MITLEELEDFQRAASGNDFWIGSTGYGRSQIDRCPTLDELVTLAIEAMRAREDRRVGG
jgi:hypothetical protein